VASQLSYLSMSPKGMYEYRRRVPAKLRPYFPRTATGRLMTEWKKAFFTTVESHVRKKWYVENEKFEAALTLAQLLHDRPDDVPYSGQIAVAKALVEKYGLHAEDAPALGPSASDADVDAFRQSAHAWNQKVQNVTNIIVDRLDDATLDQEQEEKDYRNGRWGQQGYLTPRKQVPEKDQYLDMALQIISGETVLPAKHVWRDAVELYVATNKRKNNREVEKGRRWEVKTRSLLEKFGYAMGGMKTPLDQLDRAKIVTWIWREYPKAPTRNRYINTLSAVVNCWNSENKEQVYNPFSGLSNKQHEREEAIDRRSFKPHEWFAYLDAVNALENIEFRIIGLLMLYTGCRTSEAAGIQRKDLQLSGNMPHVVFRSNRIRRMDKKGLERAVPLMTPLLEALQAYDVPNNPDEPVFKVYGNTKGFDSVSTALRKLITERLNLNDPSLVPYSTRHTVIDRARAAKGVSLARAEYVTGHKSEGSSAIHRSYGTLTPPQVLLEDMLSIFSVTDWGYYE